MVVIYSISDIGTSSGCYILYFGQRDVEWLLYTLFQTAGRRNAQNLVK